MNFIKFKFSSFLFRFQAQHEELMQGIFEKYWTDAGQENALAHVVSDVQPGDGAQDQSASSPVAQGKHLISSLKLNFWMN